MPHTEDGDVQAEGSGIGIGLLFGSQAQARSQARSSSIHQSRSINKTKDKGKARAAKSSIPNPYAPSSSESEDELEPDLEQVDNLRRSLVRPSSGPSKAKQPISDRAKKGWLAHQSIFPPSSSSSSSETEESEKETEDDTDNERAGMMGRSRKVQTKSKSRSKSRAQDIDDEDEVDGYTLSPSELHRPRAPAGREDLEEPLLGPDELDQTRRAPGAKVPVRLQVYHGRFGHWEREGLRKYKDSGFLALWLTSIIGVVFGLLFVWGSTDVRHSNSQIHGV